MPTKLAVGMRVRVYGWYGYEPIDGKLAEQSPGGSWRVEPDETEFGNVWAHPKQLRRLVKRQPAREWTLEWNVTYGAWVIAAIPLGNGAAGGELVRVREVKRGGR